MMMMDEMIMKVLQAFVDDNEPNREIAENPGKMDDGLFNNNFHIFNIVIIIIKHEFKPLVYEHSRILELVHITKTEISKLNIPENGREELLKNENIILNSEY